MERFSRTVKQALEKLSLLQEVLKDMQIEESFLELLVIYLD